MRVGAGFVAAILALATFAGAGKGVGSGARAEAFADATHIEVAGTAASARFALGLSREVEFHVFALADPYRVVIDLPEINFEIPAEFGGKPGGLIRAVRFGLFSPGKSRIVIDVGAPVSIVDPYVIPAFGDEPARLEIGLKKTSREAFLRDYALNGRRPPAPVRAEMVPANITALIQSREAGARPVIVIDPGHGGIDPGARGDTGEMEKDIVLDFGRTLRDGLAASGEFEVLMTRDSDTFVPLRERREFARSRAADLFISIHADSVRQGSVRGATVYTLSDKASDEFAAALAAHENKSDLIAGISLDEVSNEVTDILLDLARRETDTFSVDFANTLVKAMKRKVQLNNNPQRSASFVVLKAHDVPSVLVELGFLSNNHDAESLNSSAWREKAVDAVAGAVKTYFETRLAGRQ
jgi:N-acetylmuramoyl-L-alanine amidase